jgi:hypothetical protein
MHQIVTLLLETCRDAKDIDDKFALLSEINASLPFYDRIEMPSLVTDDYCQKALEVLEEKIARTLANSGREFNWP